MAKVLLSAAGISKAYSYGEDQHSLLTDMNLEVSARERVLLMGRSGSGKTTLIQILGGLLAPDSGDVRFLDQSITKMSEESLNQFRAQKLGFMFQQHHFIVGLNVIENVALHMQLQDQPNAVERAQQILTKLEIATQLHSQNPKQLSMGEQARVSLARAVAHQPTLLLMDEPSASLDDDLTLEIFQYIHALQQTIGFAVVVATHDQSLLQFSDTVYDLNKGNLEARNAGA
jgi:ABC-type lipoprotein export system ATPase subunit